MDNAAWLVFHPIYSRLSLPKNHRFPIQKYQGIKDALIALDVHEDLFLTPQAVDVDLLKQVFESKYIEQLVTGQLDRSAMRRIGFPWSEQLIERSLTAVGGTLLCAQIAIEKGKALNLTGGYHHAYADFGSGFCLINDLYLAAIEMLQYQHIDKVLIFDCDVHQGDGTAKLAEQDEQIYTVSLHCEKNFPHRKQSSDLDFGLPRGMQDAEYLETVKQAMELSINCFNPDAIIYDAGVDVHENDDLGHLKITTEGILARDQYVFDKARQLNTPILGVIGGGYQRNINDLVNNHLQLFKAAGAY